jgi:hypothetical protein
MSTDAANLDSGALKRSEGQPLVARARAYFAGKYQLSLLVSPPVSARHIEYENVWLKPHRVNYTFDWNPRS